MKLSRAEAGRLGGESTALKNIKASNALNYNVNPKSCRNCPAIIHNFCSQSCAATFNQTGKGKPHLHKLRFCVCGKSCKRVYCSKECELTNRSVTIFERFSKGEITNRPTIKKILLAQNGHRCEVCRNTEWLGDPIPLELDHIDGDAGNNFPDNLRLLCPNCHAKTPTAKGKNKDSGRLARGLPRN